MTKFSGKILLNMTSQCSVGRLDQSKCGYLGDLCKSWSINLEKGHWTNVICRAAIAALVQLLLKYSEYVYIPTVLIISS